MKHSRPLAVSLALLIFGGPVIAADAPKGEAGKTLEFTYAKGLTKELSRSSVPRRLEARRQSGRHRLLLGGAGPKATPPTIRTAGDLSRRRGMVAVRADYTPARAPMSASRMLVPRFGVRH
jgi:hypothetical protein